MTISGISACWVVGLEEDILITHIIICILYPEEIRNLI